MRRENHTSGESSCVSNGRRVRRCELSDDTPPKYNSRLSGILFLESKAQRAESNDDTPVPRTTTLARGELYSAMDIRQARRSARFIALCSLRIALCI